MFEHAVIRRRDAGDGALPSVAVSPVDACEIHPPKHRSLTTMLERDGLVMRAPRAKRGE